MHPLAKALDVDALTDLYIARDHRGMGSTTVRAGLIKCATGEGSIPAAEEKLLRATARAHRATGAPIVAHITDSLEKEQLDIFESEGVDPAARLHQPCRRRRATGRSGCWARCGAART